MCKTMLAQALEHAFQPGNPDMDCREALEFAKGALLVQFANEESEMMRGMLSAAICTMQMMLEQKACEHFDPACDGSLTKMCDIIIFG